MKNCNNISVFLICILFFSTLSVQSQQTDENTHIINQYFQQNKLSTTARAANSSFQEIQSDVNIVTLNQVGSNNQIDVKSNLNDSQGVNQVGDNNHYQFINYYNNSPSNFNILQQGNSNSLQIYGENSIINNINIIQKSNFKTLIIKNY